MRENVRIRVPRFVVMESEAVQDHSRALGNVHAIVHEIFRGAVRRRVPERSVDAQDLFDDRTNVGQVLLVFGTGPAVPSHDAVQLMLGTGLYVGVLANKGEEPLNDAGRLRAGIAISVSPSIVSSTRNAYRVDTPEGEGSREHAHVLPVELLLLLTLNQDLG